MSLLTKGGISRLSELTIDADKNWQAQGISNIKELALGMAKGDLLVRGDSILQRLQPSTLGHVLTSAGPLHIPSWQPAPGPLEYYFPTPVDLTNAQAIVTVDQNYNKDAAIGSDHVEAYVDAPGDNIKRLTPAVSLSDAQAIVSVDQSYNKNAPCGRDISIIIDGCVYEPNGGAQVDQTANAQSAAVDDIVLNPMTPAAGDMVYFGFQKVFARMWFVLSTQGVGNWTNIYEYWNGAAWSAVVDEDDQSNEWQSAVGTYRIQWTPQGDWALSTIMGMNLYWVRSRTTNFVNQTVAPLGAKVDCCLVV